MAKSISRVCTSMLIMPDLHTANALDFDTHSMALIPRFPGM